MDPSKLERARSRAHEVGLATADRHAAISESQERRGGEPLGRSYTAMTIVQDALAAYEASLESCKPVDVPVLRTITYAEIDAALEEAYAEFTCSYNARYRPDNTTFLEADRLRFRQILGAVIERIVTQAQEYRTDGN